MVDSFLFTWSLEKWHETAPCGQWGVCAHLADDCNVIVDKGLFDNQVLENCGKAGPLGFI